MGVWVYPNIVQKINGKIEVVDNDNMPKGNQIYQLNDLMFLDPLKNSLIEISEEELDLSFFTKPNSSAYGNDEFNELTFKPNDVLKLINQIKSAFESNGDKFVMPVKYDSLIDQDGRSVDKVIVESTKKGFLRTKKIYEFGTLQIHNEKAQINILDKKTDKWKAIDLTKESPILYSTKMENDEYVRNELIEYGLKGTKYYDLIKSELNNIEMLCKYALENNYELQISHS